MTTKSDELNMYLADLIGINKYRDDWDPLDDLNQTFKVLNRVLRETNRSYSHGKSPNNKKFWTWIGSESGDIEDIPEDEYKGSHKSQRKSIIEAVLRYKNVYQDYESLF